MKTKIVYVHTCSVQDIYLEQTLVSILSLRRHNPDTVVELVTDHDFYINGRKIARFYVSMLSL